MSELVSINSQPVLSAVARPAPGEERASDTVGVNLIVGLFIFCVAALSLYIFYSRGLTDLYGDAIAHMEGARRLTDSLTPGYEEIGSVWLPLFHLLVAPLAINDRLWRTGLGGSLVSTAAFAATAWFLFRLGLEMNRNLGAGIAALAAFLLCPNMLYVATNPLTEPLTMLWAVLVVYGLFRYREQGSRRALFGAVAAAFLGALTRYDGWFLIPFAALYLLLGGSGGWRARARDAAIFSLIAAAGPGLWVVHNALRFGNPLEFYNGPFSAQAIYAHQLATTGFRYPTDGSELLSLRYYVEDLKLVIGVWPLELALLGLVAWAAAGEVRVRRSAALLLLVPLPFYAHSMAHGAVPIYVPTLFPNTYYNLRYGLEMLPGVALLLSFLLTPRIPELARRGLLAVMLGILVAQAVSTAADGVEQLGVVKETLLNTPCHARTEEAMISFLRAHYDGRGLLMAMGKYPCVMPAVGIPYHKTLTEMNRKYWRQIRLGPANWPVDSPLKSLGWIIRGDTDPVDELMRAYPGAFRDFVEVTQYRFPGEEGTKIYRRREAHAPQGL